MRRLTTLLLVLVLGGPGVLLARQQAGDQTIDPTKLGVSIDRIQKRLGGNATGEASSGRDSPLKLDFRVDVIGFAPKINFFKDFDLNNGPVPWGGPTHQEMFNINTPQEYRAPAVPFNAIAWWAGMQIYEKVQAHNCAQELKEYRAKIEAGEKALVPVCAQR
ncbi:MAG: hypothetical protein AB7H88_05525 [Vicinamibacterales bacterium]